MNITNSEKINFLDSLTNISISKDGINVSLWCPFCKHQNKNKLKIVVHVEKNFYHCWLCDKKGADVSYLVSKINRNRVEEAKKLFKTRNKNIDSSLLSASSMSFLGIEEDNDIVNEDEIVTIPEGFGLLVNAYNSADPDIRDVFRYAIKRGANKSKFWFLRLGYSTSHEFRRHLILPSINSKGNLNYYTARKIDVDTHDSYKYKNASVQKKNIVFNEVNIDWTKPLTLVEGPLDLLKSNENSTCLLGSSLTEDMLLFKKIISNKTEINLALDSDVYSKTLKIAELLYKYNINVNIVDTRGYEDVGEMSREVFLDTLNKAKTFSVEDRLLSKIALL